jgi:hypothetical protein
MVREATEQGQDTGWAFFKTRGNREWVSPEAAALWAQSQGLADPHVKKVLSPAQMEKALGIKRIPAELVFQRELRALKPVGSKGQMIAAETTVSAV